MLHAIGRDRQSRSVGLMKVPIWVIKVLHHIFDILWDVWDGVSVTGLSDIRYAGRSGSLAIILHLIKCECQERMMWRPRLPVVRGGESKESGEHEAPI